MLYNFAIYIYGEIIALASHFKSKARKRYKGGKNTWKILSEKANENDKYIWFHASSLGEFEQGRPIMEKLKVENPESKILLTFFSPSGYEVRKNYAVADIICYLPIDTKKNVKRFFAMVNIEKAIFIKYEFWRNFLEELKNREIPTYLISAIFRKEQVFFKIYGGFFRKILKCFSHFFVQDENSRKLLKSLDIYKATVAGDTRFDRVADISKQLKDLPLVEIFSANEKVIVAGSTWMPDEDLVLKYFAENENIKLIIAPHEIQKSHIDNICRKINRKYALYSQINEQNANSFDCIIIDCFGILSSIYRYGKVAYIGGGFGAGIHNTIEAAVFGIPVVWGPKYEKFKEAKDLIDCGGGFSVNSYETLKNTFDRLIENSSKYGKNAEQYVEKNLGATDKIYKKIFENK